MARYVNIVCGLLIEAFERRSPRALGACCALGASIRGCCAPSRTWSNTRRKPLASLLLLRDTAHCLTVDDQLVFPARTGFNFAAFDDGKALQFAQCGS